MKIIISPAKSLDFESSAKTSVYTQPSFLKESSLLNKKLKVLSKKKLSDLMKISPALADLNYDRNQNWHQPFSLKNSKQAIYAFTGEVFRGIDITSLAEEKIPLLQDRLRILSGLYGLLKPLDLIQPYRLEMGTRISVGKADNLYKFWDSNLADALNNEMKGGDLLINLASSEYFKAVPEKALKTSMITPIFKELKNGDYKIVMTYAKRARGLMVRYIIENDINTLEELKGFNTDGYAFTESLSTETELVFTR
ncbi:peroxide stress protein YaaA [Flavobacteriaceae bacterium]|nr:peroxide stress protein YaaA [Flavobacteriaceae bacterium]MDA9327971.1 peroxide stress protein YaaA [Flavobacteriaceae bacterium]MDB4025141.1 peroxide stress protein YaaA [Flavobacteriaceae bacterium]MDB4236482.1 peroxide stress protein YaaA [Flavobacteriaceae bacterium]MDB9780815.1 peroxide stress protein YaaA [Flavobacteriaceae bacterium]